MAYEFVQLNEEPNIVNGLTTTFNDTLLDGEYFRTLNVSGRGIVVPEVGLTEKTIADGAWVEYIRYPSRTIEVEARITATDLREAYRSINSIIGKRLGQLVFSDDPDYYYSAILTGVDAPKEDSYSMITTLEFTCPDPFKYAVLETGFWGAVPEDFELATTPDRIIFTANEASAQDGGFRVTNVTTGQSIRVEFDVLAGDEVLIRWSPVRDIMVNSLSVYSSMSLSSDFESFRIQAGDEIAVLPAADGVIYARERAY